GRNAAFSSKLFQECVHRIDTPGTRPWRCTRVLGRKMADAKLSASPDLLRCDCYPVMGSILKLIECPVDYNSGPIAGSAPVPQTQSIKLNNSNLTP
ncbi:MAG TPA: hypothetical protein VLJ17_22760, partial [Xanthobacteraceae bacterium]|nr:hypothetical protein [Xanthobacteraceae bacterium]